MATAMQKLLRSVKPMHCVCEIEPGTAFEDAIKAGALMAEITGMEVRFEFNGSPFTCVPSLDRPPTVLESLGAYVRSN